MTTTFSLVRKMQFGFGFALALLFLVGIISYRSLTASATSELWVTHTHQVIEHLQTLLAAMENIETDYRGYALTGDESFLASYRIGISDAGREEETLRGMTADNPIQQPRFPILESLLKQKVAYADEVIRLRKNVGLAATANQVQKGDGKQLMDEYRSIIHDMEAEENRLLKERAQSTDVPMRRTKMALIFGSFLGLLTAVMGAWIIQRDAASQRESSEFLNLTHDAIVVRNLKSEILFWNPAAEKLYGWQRAEVLGKTTHALLQTVFPKPLKEIEMELFAEGYWEGELIHQRRDGTALTVSSRWALRKDATGKPIAILQSDRDITLRKRDDHKFRALLEAAPDAMIIVNSAGLIELVNAQMEQFFGYSREEVLGKSIDMLVPERFRGKHEQHRQGFLQSPRNREMGAGLELYGLHKDGSEFPVEISLSPIETLDGVLISSAIRDVTQRKRNDEKLRDSEERFRLLVSDVRDYAILMLDPTGHVISWNTGAQRIKQYSSQEIIGQHFSCFYPPEDIQAGKPERKLEIAIAQGRCEDEGWRLRRDGTRFWANVVITALHDGAGTLRGFGKVTRDITERKQAEERLEQRTKELALSNSGLIEANKELESFSYSVSHDLRAPLRGIDGFSHALLEDYSARLDDNAKDYLHRIRAATQRMGILIDDLLNLSRVNRGAMHTQNLDISAMAHAVAGDLRKAQPERQLELCIEDGIHAVADPNLIRIVLENLLSNAWKFTSKRPTAHVQFGRAQFNGTCAYFVRDDGAGFDPNYADRLFGAFQRLHSTTEFPGTGVGLATVQRIVRRHRGRIWAESALNQGATFYFTLAETPS
ncbi:MAG TPA: PAS domain S-box protein [Candidatus Acidoferrum sp.]|jgi:PAS domain S-box-containing protein